MSKAAQVEAEEELRSGLLHAAFGHLFRRTHLRSQQAFARAFEGCELSPLQYGILELVQLNPGITHGRLAEAMVTAPSVVTTAIKPLLVSASLEKMRNPGDARRSGYCLTPAGAAYFAKVRRLILEAEALLLAPLSKAEQRALKPLLHKLISAGRL